MYSNSSLKNNYALMESALNCIEGLDTDTVRAIIDLHQTIYAPQFESADGVASAALSTGMNGYFIGAGAAGLASAITGAVAAVAGAVLLVQLAALSGQFTTGMVPLRERKMKLAVLNVKKPLSKMQMPLWKRICQATPSQSMLQMQQSAQARFCLRRVEHCWIRLTLLDNL